MLFYCDSGVFFSLNQKFLFSSFRRLCSSVMQSKPEIIWPPASVFGMKVIDKELFKKNISMPYVSIKDSKDFQNFSRNYKNLYIRMPHFKPVIHEEDKGFKVYLNPDKVTEENIPSNLKLEYEDYVLNYDNFTHHDILRAILPEEVENISGFSTIGHLIHLNLRSEALPYKEIIGKVSFILFEPH